MSRLSDLLAGRGVPTPKEILAAELARADYDLIDALIRMREERGLTQTDLAELLGVTQQSVSKFEQIDSDPRLSTVRRYALALDVLVKHQLCEPQAQILTHEVEAFRQLLAQSPSSTRTASVRVFETPDMRTFGTLSPEALDRVVA